jgi:hypothetical protein
MCACVCVYIFQSQLGGSFESFARRVTAQTPDLDIAELEGSLPHHPNEVDLDEVDGTFLDFITHTHTSSASPFFPITPPPATQRPPVQPTAPGRRLVFDAQPTWQDLLRKTFLHIEDPTTGSHAHRTNLAKTLLDDMKQMIHLTSAQKQKLKQETKLDRQKAVWAKHSVFLLEVLDLLDDPDFLVVGETIERLNQIRIELKTQ